MRRLSKLAFVALAALLALAAPLATGSPDARAQGNAQPAPQGQTDATVGKVQAFYDKTTTFQSDFSQEFFVKSHNVRKESKGTVTFQKPGKMNWEYSNPAGNRVVSDGTTLKVYEAANKQMFEQPVNNSQYPAALSFLTGSGKLGDAFTFVMYPGKDMNFQGGDVLVGTPKTPTPAYTKVLFYVDSATSQVRRVLIVDGQGNRNRFDFENPKVNVPVPPTAFQFSPPPGTQIIRP
jgi:outer membrane lipoprotein carrier protein